MIQKTKKCIKCNETKSIDEYYKDKSTKDGLKCDCKDCYNIRTKEYCRTIPGLITHIYRGQRSSSKKRNMDMPNYSKVEFKNWILKQPNFEALFKSWVDSGYEKNLTPSVDRPDDYKPYTLDNIQLMTWGENRNKNYKDRKSGVNKKALKAVTSYNETTKDIIEYYSISEASRRTRAKVSNIINCCKGTRKTAGGFKWKYKENL